MGRDFKVEEIDATPYVEISQRTEHKPQEREIKKITSEREREREIWELRGTLGLVICYRFFMLGFGRLWTQGNGWAKWYFTWFFVSIDF